MSVDENLKYGKFELYHDDGGFDAIGIHKDTGDFYDLRGFKKNHMHRNGSSFNDDGYNWKGEHVDCIINKLKKQLEKIQHETPNIHDVFIKIKKLKDQKKNLPNDPFGRKKIIAINKEIHEEMRRFKKEILRQKKTADNEGQEIKKELEKLQIIKAKYGF